MLIRYGYEISITCPQPTPLVCLLAVHEERKADIRVPESVFTVPEVATTTYLDLFGNRCRRLVAPAGDLTLGATRRSRMTASSIPCCPAPAKCRSPNCRTIAWST